MKPFYEHAGITIYHGAVVKCDSWTQTNERGDTERGNAVKTCQQLSAAPSPDSSNQPSMSQSVPSGEQITPHGSEMPSVSAEADQGHCASSETLDPAADVEPKTQSAIISTATPQITIHQTSLWSAEPATCKSTGGLKSSENSPSRTSPKLTLPAGVKPYYLDERNGIAIFCGDCREILPHLPKVDAVITSPPYNCGKEYGAFTDDLPLGEFMELLEASILKARARIKVINVAQYIGSREERVLFRDVLETVFGQNPADEVIWDKGPANGAAWGNFPNSPRIRAQHESIYVFGQLTMPNGNGLDWAKWSRLTTSIWSISSAVDLSKHPAVMPLEIASRCVSLWSDVQGTILDPFMGSGTTLVAAKNLGRKAIGIEIEEKYCEIAAKRLAQEVFDFPTEAV